MTDQRYSLFRYGPYQKYGASSTDAEVLAWAVEIDWDGDGIFDGSNEADRLIRAPSIRRGRRTMLRPSGQGFEGIGTGVAVITLSNHDGRFDAWNTASPLYPNVESGKLIRIRVMDRSTGTIYNRFYGTIVDIEPVEYGEDARVVIRAEDALRMLRDTYVTTRRGYPFGTFEPFAIDQCIHQVLESAGVSSTDRQLDATNYGVRYWYASGDRSAAAEIEDLALSFFGYFFIAADGIYRFIGRFNNDSSVVSISQSEMLKDIGNPQPWSIRRNVVKLRFHVRRRADDANVWEPLDTDPPIQPGDTKEYFVEYTYNGYPAYLENIETNIRYSLSPYEVSIGSLSTTDSVADYSTRAFLSITNEDTRPVYVYQGHDHDANFPENYSYIRGDITWTEKVENISKPRDPSSVADQRALVLDSLWYQDRNQARDFVDNYHAFISELHKTPIIQIENRFAKQFTPDLFDVITVDIPKLGISSETFRVGGIEEESVGETAQAVRTTLYLEPYIAVSADAARWNFGEWGVNTWQW